MNPLRALLRVPRSSVVSPPPPGAGAGHQDLRDPGERGQVPPRAGKSRDHPSPRGARGSGRPTGAPGAAGGAAAPVPRPGGCRGGTGNGAGPGAAPLRPPVALNRSQCPPRTPVTESGVEERGDASGNGARECRNGEILPRTGGFAPPGRADTCALPGRGAARAPLAPHWMRRTSISDATGDSALLLAGLAAPPPPGVPGTPLGCGGRPASRGCAARFGSSPVAGAELREHDGHRDRGLAGLEPRGGLAAPARAGGEVGVAGAAAAAAPRLRPRTPLVLPTAPRPPQSHAQPGELLLRWGFHGHLPAGPPA